MAMSNATFNVNPLGQAEQPARVTLRNGLVTVSTNNANGINVSSRLKTSMLLGMFGHSFSLDKCLFASDLYACLVQMFGSESITVIEGWQDIEAEMAYQPPAGAVT